METPLLNPAELYDKRRAKDSGRLRAYNRLLEAIFHRIRTISRLPQSTSYLVYTVPPFVFGLPRLDLEDVTTYLIFQLRHAGYEVRFTYPNLLYISWAHHERTYLTEQSPIMLSMLQSAERTAAEMERREREASRLLAPRKSGRKVKFQEPSPAAVRTVLGGFSANATVAATATPTATPTASRSSVTPSNAAVSAGSAPSAASYVPNASFLQSVLSPPPTASKPSSVPDYFR
jgi:hypothetical protein